jgi:membrane protein DedA with SNARE-associated domain
MLAPEYLHAGAYVAIAVGTFFEGEMIMLAAGVAAGTGLLSLPLIITAGMAGIFASDTLCFLIGRFAGRWLARWFPRAHARLDGVFRLIQRHDEKLLVFYQFVPGLCTVTPLAFGMTRIPLARFLALDFLGNGIWTLAFSCSGYACGAAFGQSLATLPAWAVVSAYVAGLTVIGTLLWRFRSRATRGLAMGS